MLKIAPDVYLLATAPRYAINTYLIGDVLLDSGTPWTAKRLIRQLQGVQLSAHALTHAHPDHYGASQAICQHFGIPLWCGEGDASAVETGDFRAQAPDNILTRLQRPFMGGAIAPVARRLREGDVVAGFRVIETPGHSPGHLAFWREQDGVLILGDVLLNLKLKTMQPHLREPIRAFTPNPALNRDSARKLAALNPQTVCFGHGEPIREGARVVDFIHSL